MSEGLSTALLPFKGDPGGQPVGLQHQTKLTKGTPLTSTSKACFKQTNKFH